MGAFDDVLSEYQEPSAADIVLPGRVGTPAGKGGANGPKDTAGANTSGTASAAAAPVSGTAPEPEPQLPEGSDDDEEKAAAAAEEAAAEEAENAAQAAAAEKAKQAAAPGTAEPAEEAGGSAPVPGTEPAVVPAAGEAGYPVIPRKGAGLTFEGESAYLKLFPRVLIDRMREILKPTLGEAFARDLSQVSIVTAFVIASMGVELTTDEHTAKAVEVFRRNDPRAELLEKRTADIQTAQAKFEGVLKSLVERTGKLTDTAAVVEMALAYSLAERTAHLVTDGVMPETIDVTQKRALAARENIRKRVKLQTQMEKDRAGRPIR